MTTYTITPEHFVQARERLHHRRDALAERHRKELGELEMQTISELDKLDDLERAVAALAAQSPADRPKPPRKTRNESKAKSARLPPTKYTAEQDAQLLALPADRRAAMNALRQLAVDWSRSYGSLQRRRSELIRERVREEEPTAAEGWVPAVPVPSSSETPRIVEPTPAPAPSIFDGHRAVERKPPERGKPVHGLMENGPEDRRVYGGGFESAGRD